MSPACNAPRKRNDVVESLRRQYHGAVAGRRTKPEFARDVQHSPIQLQPRQSFRNAVPVLLVINKRERRVIGLQTGALAQHSGNRRLKHGSRIAG